MTDRLITPPAALPVSMEDARTAARVSGTDLDSEIISKVATITEELEHEIGRAIITQLWRVTLDDFEDAIRLPMPPVRSVTSVKYLDTSGVEQTLDPADYYADLITEPSYVVPAAGRAWPTTFDRINAVSVDVVCGYGDTEASTPSGIKGYILARIAEEFAPAGTPKSEHLCRLLDRYKVY